MGTEDQLAWPHYPRPDETSPIRTWYSNFTRWTLFRVGKLRAHWLLETYTDVYQAAGRPEQFDMNDVQHRNLIHGITTDRHFSLKQTLIHTTHVTERFVTERCPPPFLAPPPYLFLSSFRSSEISCGPWFDAVSLHCLAVRRLHVAKNRPSINVFVASGVFIRSLFTWNNGHKFS